MEASFQHFGRQEGKVTRQAKTTDMKTKTGHFLPKTRQNPPFPERKFKNLVP